MSDKQRKIDFALQSRENLLTKGRRLAENTYWPWLEGLETNGDIIPNCALLMDNLAHHYLDRFGLNLVEEGAKAINEATVSSGIANFTTHAFPLVRAAFPTMAALDLVSMQPMDGPTGLVFYLNAVYGTTKGATTQGTNVFENPDEYYSSETISSEAVGTGDTSATQWVGSLGFIPIRAGTVVFTHGANTVTDDGAGGFGTGGSGTIDYNTGAYDITFTAAPAAVAITVAYEYILEGNPRVPQIDLTLTSESVTAYERKLKFNLNAEASFNLSSQHGISAGAELDGVIGTEFKYEVDQEILRLLKASALDNTSAAYAPTFLTGVPTGTSLPDHYDAFFATLLLIEAKMLTVNGRAKASWIECGTEVAAVIKMMSKFDESGAATVEARGIYYIGTLGKWKVYENSQAVVKSFMMGAKPASPLNQGFIYAPYIPMYTTPNIMLDDFIARQGFLTWYATKLIHSNFYIKSVIAVS